MLFANKFHLENKVCTNRGGVGEAAIRFLVLYKERSHWGERILILILKCLQKILFKNFGLIIYTTHTQKHLEMHYLILNHFKPFSKGAILN